MNRNSGWDHDIRPATVEEREPYWPDRPEDGPTCKYCTAGVAFIGSYTRWQGTYSRITGERRRIPHRLSLELCAGHAREWSHLHGVALTSRPEPLKLPTPSCPYCGRQRGVDETLDLLRKLGPGIHKLEFDCLECGRGFCTKLSFGLQYENEMSEPLPPHTPRKSADVAPNV
jgi:hypothetical protein